jgi:hypothetical protein
MIGFRRNGALRAASLAGLIALASAAASCSGGGAKPDGSSTGAAGGGAAGTSGGGGNAVTLCKELVSTLCNRSNTCGMLNATPQEIADCITLENVEFGCDRAASTGFPTCLSDVKLLSCAALFTPQGLSPPASCDEPLNTIPLSVAQMKCAALGHVICQKIFMCDGVTPTANDLAACDAEAFFAIECQYAVDVGATYDQ